MKHRSLLPLAGLLLALAAPALAQFAPGAPDEADTPLDAATRAAAIESLAVAARDLYVFPDKGAELAKQLRRRLAQKQYDRITGHKEFADSLTGHMQAATRDLHMRVHYRLEPLPRDAGDEEQPNEAERRRQLEQESARNFGFDQVRRLPGNVGYLDLRQFSGAPEAQATAVAAMNFLGHCDALIVDLRRNGGGSPGMIQTLLSYLVEPGRRLHFNDFYEREGDRWVQYHTSPYVPGPRLAGRPVYVLTSARTCASRSAACGATATSGFTPTPSQLVLVTGFTARPVATNAARWSERRTRPPGFAAPAVVAPTSVPSSCVWMS